MRTRRRRASRVSEFTRLDHVQLAMPPGREDDARAFYVGALGFAELAKPRELAARGGAWFRSGSITLHVGAEIDFRPARKAHPALRCAGYAELCDRLRERGIAVEDDPSPFEGKPHAYVADPFGNRIELIAD